MVGDEPGHAHHHGDHDHRHDDHSNESYDHVQGGSPVLDIGGDIGALVATMDPAEVGSELHVRPADDPTITVHTLVWERDQTGPTVAAAVFVDLVAGTYDVLDHDGAPVRTVVVRGGEVATVDLRH